MELKRIYYYFFAKKPNYSLNKMEKKLNHLKKNIELEIILKQTENNTKQQKLFRDNRKRKIESLDGKTRKKITGKTGETLVRAPKNSDDEAVIPSIIDIALSSTAAYGKGRNEIIMFFSIFHDFSDFQFVILQCFGKRKFKMEIGKSTSGLYYCLIN